MTLRIGINGFGRIGRLIVRAVIEYGITDVEIVAINSPGALEPKPIFSAMTRHMAALKHL